MHPKREHDVFERASALIIDPIADCRREVDLVWEAEAVEAFSSLELFHGVDILFGVFQCERADGNNLQRLTLRWRRSLGNEDVGHLPLLLSIRLVLVSDFNTIGSVDKIGQ